MYLDIKRAALFFAFFIGLILIFYKSSQGGGGDVVSGDGVLANGFMLFWPDEITYLNWLETRGDSFLKVVAGERDATNLFGYFVGFTYLVLGQWELTYVLGLLGLFLFYFTAVLLVENLQFNKSVSSVCIAVFMFSPAVLMLASSLLRDLYIIALLNIIIYLSYEKRLFLLLLALLVLFFLRNFYIPLIGPLIIFFWFHTSPYRKILIWLSCFFLILGSVFIVTTFQSLYGTTHLDLFMRVISAVFSVNVELVRWQENFNKGLLYSLEYLGLLYQAIITVLFFFYLLVKKLRVNIFFVVFLSLAISLGLIYGHFLGYFVSRTRLILLWLIMIYFMVDSSGGMRRRDAK